MNIFAISLSDGTLCGSPSGINATPNLYCRCILISRTRRSYPVADCDLLSGSDGSSDFSSDSSALGSDAAALLSRASPLFSFSEEAGTEGPAEAWSFNCLFPVVNFL